MPLIATQLSTGNRIDITTLSGDLKSLFTKGDLACPLCGELLTPVSEHERGGGSVMAHFRHVENCTADYDMHPESAAHLALKRKVLTDLINGFRDRGVAAKVEFEVPIAMDWRSRGRVADVLVTYATGWQEAHEIQLSPISLEEFQERTYDYERAGISVIWYLGEKNRDGKQAITDWFAERFLGYNTADIGFIEPGGRNRVSGGQGHY